MCVCAAGAGWLRPSLGVVRTVMAASMCFACSVASQLDGVFEAGIAERIFNGFVKVVWRHGCVPNTIVFCSWTW